MRKRSARRWKAFMCVLAAIAMLVLIPEAGTMRASAAEPVTFAVKYLPDRGEWRFQANTSTFDEGKYHRELYYLYQTMQEGDLVVVYNDSTSTKELDLGKAHLSNLTIANCKPFTIVYAGPVDDCYVLIGSQCSINAEITNAYVYDTSLCNFGGNVKEMNLYYFSNEVKSTLGCSGTVDHLCVRAADSAQVRLNLYNFTAGTLNIQSGSLKTSDRYYSRTPAPVAPEVTLTAANFDYVRYANDYPDVKSAFGLDAAALYNHYITCGINEGRVAYGISSAYSDFDYVRYANDYPDLKAAFGYNAEALFNHYITRGAIERRVAYNISGTTR